MDSSVIRAYVNHFLPREVVGPVLIVFSLEGVIDGLFELYVPEGFDIVGWAIVFVLSMALIGYWGATDEEGLAELEERIEELSEEEQADEI